MMPLEFVCNLPRGFKLYREPNGAGGYIYISNEVGNGVHVWDTCLVDHSTLLLAIGAEAARQLTERSKTVADFVAISTKVDNPYA